MIGFASNFRCLALHEASREWTFCPFSNISNRQNAYSKDPYGISRPVLTDPGAPPHRPVGSSAGRRLARVLNCRVGRCETPRYTRRRACRNLGVTAGRLRKYSGAKFVARDLELRGAYSRVVICTRPNTCVVVTSVFCRDRNRRYRDD